MEIKVGSGVEIDREVIYLENVRQRATSPDGDSYAACSDFPPPGDGHEVKIYDGRPAPSGSQARGKRDGRIGYESGDESIAAARNDKSIRNEDGNESGQGHILYERDSDEEPPDSDEDPDDDLDI